MRLDTRVSEAMTGAVFYEDVAIGAELPPLAKHPTTQQLVKWANASGDYNEIHYDKDYAQRAGLTGVIVHGRLGLSWLGQLITGWMGVDGTLKKIEVSYRKMLYPDTDVVCRGKVIEKFSQNSEHLIKLEIWLESGGGERVTQGTAVVSLPSRDN